MADLPFDISCPDAQALLAADDAVVLIDCRERDEHALVAIEKARLVPMSEMQERVGELAEFTERRIIVHCHHGGRSAQVTAWLRKQGFSRAQNMSGGIDQWAVEIEPGMARY